MLYQIHSLALHTVDLFWNLILKNHWTWTWKMSDFLTGLELTIWYTGLWRVKHLNYLTGLELILYYVGVWLEKYSNYFTGSGLILWYIGIGLE